MLQHIRSVAHCKKVWQDVKAGILRPETVDPLHEIEKKLFNVGVY